MPLLNKFNMAQDRDSCGGCGCLILIILAIAFGVNTCRDSNKESTTTKSDKPSAVYQPSNRDTYHAENVEEELLEEDKQYLNNSLRTGATPYTKYYGENYKCPYYQCSGINVTAPRESDIVVIIKRNNKDGKVIQHGYIRAGESFQFDIPDGTFQTFFYYGEGWNPNKEMANGIKGGFVKDEIFSKDEPQYISSAVLSYVLQLQHNGNFQTKGSNKREMF